MAQNLALDSLRTVIDHLFMPPRLSQEATSPDDERGQNLLLTRLVSNHANTYFGNTQIEEQIRVMLEHIQATADRGLSRDRLAGDLENLAVGGECI